MSPVSSLRHGVWVCLPHDIILDDGGIHLDNPLHHLETDLHGQGGADALTTGE